MLDTGFNKMIKLIEKRKNNAYKKVNEEMILLYLDIGKYLFELQQKSKYGDKITVKASEFMKKIIQILEVLQKEILKEWFNFIKFIKMIRLRQQC